MFFFTIFSITGNNIKIVIPDNQLKIPSLTHLDLHLNDITTLTNKLLMAFPDLKVINFHHNKIVKIPSDVFLFNRFALNFL